MNTKINDMFLAYSSDDEIRQLGQYGGAVTSIMKYLLEKGIVDGVVGVTKGYDIFDALPVLVTDPDEVVKTSGSFHFGTLNIAKFVSKYLNGARDMKLAISCKPCDAMTFRELMKKGKIIEDNVILIGVNCGGTMKPLSTMKMIKDTFNLDPKDIIDEKISDNKLIIETAYGEKAFRLDELEKQGLGRRENCKRCNLKIPSNTDLALGNWGVTGSLKGNATFIEVFSQKGAEILDNIIDNDLIKVEKADEKGIEIRQNINNIMLEKSMARKDIDYAGSSGDIIEVIHHYEDELSRCMKCYGCREACPLCFCDDCCLEADGPEWVYEGYTPAAPFFHLTRMVHMADSCTNCGQCSDVCPSEIPVAKIWSTVNNKIREVYGYIPGMRDDKAIPFTDHTSKAKFL